MNRNIFAAAPPVFNSAAHYNEPIEKMLDELRAYVSASYWFKLCAIRDDVRASEMEYQQDLYAFLANMLTVAKFDRLKESAMTDYITRDGAICAVAEAVSFLKEARKTIKVSSKENLFTKIALAELAKIDNYFSHIIPEANEYRYIEGMKQLKAALSLVSAEKSGDNPVKACLLQAINLFGRASEKPSEFQSAAAETLREAGTFSGSSDLEDANPLKCRNIYTNNALKNDDFGRSLRILQGLPIDIAADDGIKNSNTPSSDILSEDYISAPVTVCAE